MEAPVGRTRCIRCIGTRLGEGMLSAKRQGSCNARGAAAVLSPLVPWRRSLGAAAPSQFRSATLRGMAEYAVAHLEEIDELSDGRAPFRPIRHKLGITSFG